MLKRRTLLKAAGQGTLLSALPTLYAQTEQAETDVQFLKRDDDAFDRHQKLFNKRIERYPKIIAVCETELGVQQTVQYAHEHHLPISIKSGGHCFEGFSLNDDGLVIDLSKMNQLMLTSDNQLIAEPAVRLKQLYGYCLPKGRLLPVGSCGTVGLAGLVLGGGYGLFSRQFGLTCDHLTGVRMVTVEGKVVDSDAFPDLLWGCRGGGNGNFGVITQFRFDTAAAPETLHQHRFQSFELTPKKAVELAKFWFEQCDDLPQYAFSAFVLNGKTLTVMLTATEHDEKMVEILEQFNQTMGKNAELKPDPIDIGVKYYYGRDDPMYFKNISAGYYQGFDDLDDCLEQLFTQVAGTPGMIFQINTLGGEINNPARIKDSAYPHRNANYLGEAQCYWEKPEHAARSMGGMKAIQGILYENNIRQHYVNYPDLNIKNHTTAYYGDSYERLQKLKRMWDPDNCFSYAQGVREGT
ncbi:MAG: FAD-dependent oxidoreductase [Pseudomonadota bacterium]